MTVKNIVIGVLALSVTGLLGFSISSGAVTSKDIQTGIKKIIKETMSSEIQNLKDQIIELKKCVQLNTDFRIEEYLKLILKNAKKIVSDPEDVKRSDIELCLSYLGKIPNERKTEDVQAAIELIIDWDANHP